MPWPKPWPRPGSLSVVLPCGKFPEAANPPSSSTVTVSLPGISSRPSAQSPAERPQAVFERAVTDFLAGRVAESVVGFDAAAKLDPGQAPEFWQRGIALYYAGRYKDCRLQFESHRTVNPNDVENAAWHFLCVARAESPQAAKRALLPVGPDSRAPMTQVYQMMRGDLTKSGVLSMVLEMCRLSVRG